MREIQELVKAQEKIEDQITERKDDDQLRTRGSPYTGGFNLAAVISAAKKENRQISCIYILIGISATNIT